MPNLSSTIASMFMSIELSTSAKTFSKTDKANTHDLCAKKGASKGAYKVSNGLLPEGFDAEYKALMTARSKARAVFDKYTIHVARSADGNKNDGSKWIRASHIADGSFLNEWRQAEQEFNNAHQAFINAYPQLLRSIEYHSSNRVGGMGEDFDINAYPTLQDVIDGFALTLKGPFPIADGSIYGTMPLDPDTREALEKQYDAVQRRAVSVASQNAATELAKYLKVMADMTKRLSEFNSTPTHQRQGKAPAIRETLASNVAEAVAKARAFAIPDTDQGSKLMAYLDEIEESIQPDRLDADYIKAVPPSYLNNISNNAAAIAAAMSGEDWD
jgi:hypothetical protein